MLADVFDTFKKFYSITSTFSVFEVILFQQFFRDFYSSKIRENPKLVVIFIAIAILLLITFFAGIKLEFLIMPIVTGSLTLIVYLYIRDGIIHFGANSPEDSYNKLLKELPSDDALKTSLDNFLLKVEKETGTVTGDGVVKEAVSHVEKVNLLVGKIYTAWYNLIIASFNNVEPGAPKNEEEVKCLESFNSLLSDKLINLFSYFIQKLIGHPINKIYVLYFFSVIIGQFFSLLVGVTKTILFLCIIVFCFNFYGKFSLKNSSKSFNTTSLIIIVITVVIVCVLCYFLYSYIASIFKCACIASFSSTYFLVAIRYVLGFSKKSFKGFFGAFVKRALYAGPAIGDKLKPDTTASFRKLFMEAFNNGFKDDSSILWTYVLPIGLWLLSFSSNYYYH